MYIPLASSISQQVVVRLPSNARDLPPTRLPQLEYRLQDIISQAIMVTRFVIIAIGMSALAGRAPGAQLAIGLALVLAGGLAVLVYRYEVPYWMRLAGDGAVIALLVTASGGVASPIIALPLGLIVLGALHGGVRDSVAATCMGIMILLMVALYDLPYVSQGFAAVLFVQFVAGVAVTWMSSRITAAVLCLYTGVQQQVPASTRPVTNTERYVGWQREALSVVDAQDTTEVVRIGRRLAYEIVGGTVDFYLPGAEVPVFVDGARQQFMITNSHANQRSTLVVHCDPKTVDHLQYDALAQLLTLVQLRSLTLLDNARHERDQQAMKVLWQMTGHRADGPVLDQVTASAELCRALDLTGICMVSSIAGLDVACEWQTPTDGALLEGCDKAERQLMIEAMQLEKMRIVVDGASSLLVLPVSKQRALAVVGNIEDEETQRILMMFADMVIRFATKANVKAA
jgi:hypothetical protein